VAGMHALTQDQAKSVLVKCLRWVRQNYEFRCMDVCYTYNETVIATGYIDPKGEHRLQFKQSGQFFLGKVALDLMETCE
jgi:hypothetical protein